jgi:predicted extracellular nuclease
LTVFGLGLVSLVDADTADLFFSEHVEGSSWNKALEIYNGTGAAVDLEAESYAVEMYFNGSSSAGLTINLSGTVASGDVFVFVHQDAEPALLAKADQIGGFGWFNDDGTVVLKKGGAGGTILDVIGKIGEDPDTQWGSGPQSTQDNTQFQVVAKIG